MEFLTFMDFYGLFMDFYGLLSEFWKISIFDQKTKRKHNKYKHPLHIYLAIFYVPTSAQIAPVKHLHIFCYRMTRMTRMTPEEITEQRLHQKFLIHVLCAFIMGADVTLDIMQTADYGRYDKTHDLFIASLVIISLVPAALFYTLCKILSDFKVRNVFKFCEKLV